MTMRPALALLGFLIFVFVGGALISPWVYHALVRFEWTEIPFRRVVDRCLVLLALVGLWPFVKALGVRSREELGLKMYRGAGRDVLFGLVLGSVLFAIAAVASLVGGATFWIARGGWPQQIAGAAATAIAVAILEEILFRGAIYTALTRVSGLMAGLWVSSGLYAILHFFARPENPTVVDWKSGFVVLGRMLQGFADFQQVVPGFFNLAVLGVLLVLAFKKTGALYMSTGIHAAVVFGMKLFAFGARTNAGANTWFWGTSEKLVDGWFCFVLLVVVTLGFAKIKPQTA